MSRRVFEEIKAGLEDAITIAQGKADPKTYRVHVPQTVDVKAVRRRLGLTQAEFARRYNLTLARVRDWEQGRSEPDSAVRAYLKVIERAPKVVEKALAAR
jgi:putative transcriptional regulator